MDQDVIATEPYAPDGTLGVVKRKGLGRMLGVSDRTIGRWLHDGVLNGLPSIRIAGSDTGGFRRWRISSGATSR